MHDDADLLLHLARQALHLVDPRRALLRLPAPAQRPVARAREEQHDGRRIGPEPRMGGRGLGGERRAVRLGDRRMGEGLEQEAQGRVPGARPRGAGLEEAQEADGEALVGGGPDQVDPLDAAVRVAVAERRIGGRALQGYAPVEEVDGPLVGQPDGLAALAAPAHQRGGQMLLVLRALALGGGAAAVGLEVALARLGAARCDAAARRSSGLQAPRRTDQRRRGGSRSSAARRGPVPEQGADAGSSGLLGARCAVPDADVGAAEAG